MVSCCQCEGIESLFNKKTALKELKTYNAKGPRKTTRLLMDALKSAGVQDRTLLDIGGGVGVIQYELLAAGVSRVQNVDAASGYLAVAKTEAQRRAVADRIDYTYGDFVDLAQEVPAADIITLDRVICCYPDMRALVGLSAAKAQHYYALVYPREILLFRLFRPVASLIFWLMRNPFRLFLHATSEVDALVRSYGFKPLFTENTLLWQVVVYER